MALSLKDPYWEFTIEMQPGADSLNWNDHLLCCTMEHRRPGLRDVLVSWQKQTDMAEMELLYLGGNEYTWELIHSDGRRWLQTLRLGATIQDTAMNFQITDFWTMKELKGGRTAVLSLLVELLLERKVQRIKVDWA